MAKELRKNQMFNMVGYDIMATLDAMDGSKVVVLNNNSTHFLVAEQAQDDFELSTRLNSMGRFEESVRYNEEKQVAPAYREALNIAVRLATQE